MRPRSTPPSRSSRPGSANTQNPPPPRRLPRAHTIPAIRPPRPQPRHRPWCRHAWADTNRIRADAWTFLLNARRNLRMARERRVYSLRAERQSAGDGDALTGGVLSQNPLAIGLHSLPNILIRNPFPSLIHDPRLQHRGGAGPMQIDPVRNLSLRHASPAADARGHLAGQRFDIRGHR